MNKNSSFLKLSLKNELLVDTFATITTSIWFLPILCPWMLCNDIFLWEGIFTMTALVWLILKLIIKLFYKYLGMWENLSQQMHRYGFSPLCVFFWFTRWLFLEKTIFNSWFCMVSSLVCTHCHIFLRILPQENLVIFYDSQHFHSCDFKTKPYIIWSAHKGCLYVSP